MKVYFPSRGRWTLSLVALSDGKLKSQIGIFVCCRWARKFCDRLSEGLRAFTVRARAALRDCLFRTHGPTTERGEVGARVVGVAAAARWDFNMKEKEKNCKLVMLRGPRRWRRKEKEEREAKGQTRSGGTEGRSILSSVPVHDAKVECLLVRRSRGVYYKERGIVCGLVWLVVEE